MPKAPKAFKSPGPLAEFMGTLEEFGIVKPVMGHMWTFGQALDNHFYPIPDWVVNGTCLVILLYALMQLKVI